MGCGGLPAESRAGRAVHRLAQGVFRALAHRDALVLTLAAAAILMIANGARLSLGLFVSPLNTATGIGVVGICFELAVGQ